MMYIPERQAIYTALKARALRLDQLTSLFELDHEQAQAMHRRLEAMVRDGQLRPAARDAYQADQEAHRASGTFIASDRSMTVCLDAADGACLELPRRLTQGLVDGDQVAVYLLRHDARGQNDGRSFPVAVEILGRDREVAGVVTATGRIEPLHEIGSAELHCVARQAAAPVPGSVVIMHLTTPAHRSSMVTGEIVAVLGDRESAGMEVDIVLRTYGIPSRFREEALSEAQRHTPVSASDLPQRTDLRTMSFVTIDGEDAKDFDDAVLFEKDPHGGWLLWVAIADVAHYVRPHSALDAAAYARGNSVYFPGRVVPMLPPSLSDELCSLRPDEDRLALVCRMNLSPRGELKGYRFMRAVIRSQARLSYTEVGAFLNGDRDLHGRPRQVEAMLEQGGQVLAQLLRQRERRAALDIDTVETQLLFDRHGVVRDIVPRRRNDAHRLIEECMICANICAARYLAEHDQALPYRVHAGLKSEALEDLVFFLRERGLSLTGESNRDLARLLAEVKGRDDAHAVQSVILRSLSAALYQPDNAGHYGLALERYAHFTSPIRRYPDLLVHRAIHFVLEQDSREPDRYGGKSYHRDELQVMGAHCSMTEKRADEATRDVAKYLKCLYIRDRVGEKFTGVVVGVTNFGLFMELDGVYIEGLLHVTSLDSDYYFFDRQGHRLVGESGGKVYRLGDRFEVILTRVVAEERKIDFALPGDRGRRKHARRRRQ